MKDGLELFIVSAIITIVSFIFFMKMIEYHSILWVIGCIGMCIGLILVGKWVFTDYEINQVGFPKEII